MTKFFETRTVDDCAVTLGSEFAHLGIEEKFLLVIDQLYARGYGRLLFVLDELDRAHATKGLAGFIKNESSARLKFLLVGIGHDVSDLLADHRSLERSLIQVREPVMDEVELLGVIDKALAFLTEKGMKLTFSEAAKARLAKAAGGLPWFVHVLGQEALRRAIDMSRDSVAESDIEGAIDSLAANRFAQSFSDLYQRAIKECVPREVVLRLFAKWPLDDIPIGEVYRIARALGIKTPWVWKKDLMSHRILAAPPLHGSGTVRFRDALFKRYVDIRPALFVNVKEDVDRAWLTAISRVTSSAT